jgi:hypothetical protein
VTTPKTRRLPWERPFLEALARVPNVRAACVAANCDRTNAYRQRKRDPEFAAAWDTAIEQSVDLLEQVAHRRATTGEPRVETRIRLRRDEAGNMVEEERTEVTAPHISDVLLIFLLKAHRPEKFRDRYDVRHAGPDGGPVQVEAKEWDAAIERLGAEVHSIADARRARDAAAGDG